MQTRCTISERGTHTEGVGSSVANAIGLTSNAAAESMPRVRVHGVVLVFVEKNPVIRGTKDRRLGGRIGGDGQQSILASFRVRSAVPLPWEAHPAIPLAGDFASPSFDGFAICLPEHRAPHDCCVGY